MKFLKLLDCDYFCNPSQFDEVFLPYLLLQLDRYQAYDKK